MFVSWPWPASLELLIPGSEGAGGHGDPPGGSQHRAREEQPGTGPADVHPAPQEVRQCYCSSIPGNAEKIYNIMTMWNVFRITTRSRWTSGNASGWDSVIVLFVVRLLSLQ